MWISRSKWQLIEERLAALEKQAQKEWAWDAVGWNDFSLKWMPCFSRWSAGRVVLTAEAVAELMNMHGYKPAPIKLDPPEKFIRPAE